MKNKLFEKFDPESLPMDILYTEPRELHVVPGEVRKLCIPLYGYEDSIKKRSMKPISKLLNPDYLVK